MTTENVGGEQRSSQAHASFVSFTSAAPAKSNPLKEDGKESAPSVGAFLAAFFSLVFQYFIFSIRLEIIKKKRNLTNW